MNDIQLAFEMVNNDPELQKELAQNGLVRIGCILVAEYPNGTLVGMQTPAEAAHTGTARQTLDAIMAGEFPQTLFEFLGAVAWRTHPQGLAGVKAAAEWLAASA